jgi:hypothetical protein
MFANTVKPRLYWLNLGGRSSGLSNNLDKWEAKVAPRKTEKTSLKTVKGEHKDTYVGDLYIVLGFEGKDAEKVPCSV